MQISYSFFERLQAEAVVLTPNRRLSATLHKLYQHYQIQQGNITWKTPQILPLISWANQLWMQWISQSCTPFPMLLTPAQEQFIWEKILQANQENEQLLQISETAKLAQSAFGLLNQWQVDWHHPLFQTSEDAHALQGWIEALQNLCQQQNWITSTSLISTLIQKIRAGLISVPKHIILFGLTEYTPQLMEILDACKAANCRIEKFNHQISNETCQRINCTNQEDEIETAARWAKDQLRQQPDAVIACVFPALDKIRDRVAQIFSSILDKEVFNISAGKSLASYPVIHSALMLLRLNTQRISNELFTHLLTTPFLGEAESERIKRAHCEARHRFANQNNLNLAMLGRHCPRLAKRLRDFFQLIDSYQDTASYSEWAERFNHLLMILGWPGERSLNSDEYQVVESWQNLLHEYRTLDWVVENTGSPLPLSNALKTLQKMAYHFQFQPQSPSAPIQILGMLEAAGMPFDALWIAGMDDIAWPPPPRPNPFIPRRLQREKQMPHATAERELHFCRLLTQQFRQAAKHVVFSHADKKDELMLQPSPLIKDIVAIQKTDLHLEDYLSPALAIYQSRKMETVLDDKAPPLRPNENIHGGMSVIQHQALCPFKSFAHWRLHARELESFMPGFKAKERGTTTHKALEILWQQMKDHATLVAMPDPDLHTLIQSSIDAAMMDHAFTKKELRNDEREMTNYIRLEKMRLHDLLWNWLQLEKQRTPFKVLMNEKSSELQLGPLTLSVRMDRIDELDNGKKFIIDYKTGRNNDVNHWFGDRPEAPQLPLYAILDAKQTCGISFAQLFPGEHAFKGVGDVGLEMKGIKSFTEIKKTSALSWQEQMQQWHNTLTQLGQQFYDGHAQVDPKDASQTCGFCALQSFCRINDNLEETCNQH